MKKLLPLLLLILIGCSEPEPINMDEMLNLRDQVYYTKDTNKPYSGPVFSLHKNVEFNIQEGTLKEGKWDGLYKSFRRTGERIGQEEYEINYKNGMKHGDWKHYYISDDILKLTGRDEKTFVDDRLIMRKRYYEIFISDLQDDILKLTEESFINSDNNWIDKKFYYHNNGELRIETFSNRSTSDIEPLNCKVYNENGQLLYEGNRCFY